MAIFKDFMDKHKEGKIIAGELAFKLHDTYGFPIELTREIAAENGFALDEKGFEKEMELQRDRGRTARVPSELGHFSATKFTGYDKTEDQGKVVAVFPDKKRRAGGRHWDHQS